MKILLSSIATLIVGLGIGHFWGASNTEVKHKDAQNTQPNSKSSNAIRSNSNAPINSATIIERQLSANGFTTNGVFGKLAEQINRYQQMSDADFEAEIAHLSTLKNSDRYISSYLLFTAWGEKNPEAALEYLERDELLPNF